MEGLDQTAAAAEAQGALCALRAAVQAQVSLHLYIDNRGVQRAVAHAMAGRPIFRGTCPFLWREMSELCSQLPGTENSCHWVPSHGKESVGWRPPEGHCEATMRQLNHEADREASSRAKQKYNAESREEYRLRRRAVQWSRLALDRLARASRACSDRWLPPGRAACRDAERGRPADAPAAAARARPPPPPESAGE